MPGRRIRLGGLDDFVELQFVEYDESGHGGAQPDVHLAVTLQCDGFRGAYENVWIEGPVWKAFLGELRALERSRVGRATVFAMSPDEFELRLRVVDRAGHLEAWSYLSKYHFRCGQPDAARSRVECCAAVDASMLRVIVEAFEEIDQPEIEEGL